MNILLSKWIGWCQQRINRKNRNRLLNKEVTIISSNCTGGVLYHWLGLKFNSPFINLYLDNLDFIRAMENFDKFLSTNIFEDMESQKTYPVGIGWGGVKLHFMHYNDFSEAKSKWDERINRINKDNMCVMLTNFNFDLPEKEREEILNRFNRLPFRNKLIFSGIPIDKPNVIYLSGYNKVHNNKNIFATKNILGYRYIDQFDYVEYFNQLKKNS